jgi:hypothetical protein
MIKKERQVPLKLEAVEALIRRLLENHPNKSIILEDHKKLMAGYRGEQNLDYHLSFLPEKDFLIFNDLRLLHQNKVFQLDTFILTTNFGLIIETKNIKGVLTFDKFKQMIRTFDNKEEGFLNPLDQARRQQTLLTEFLLDHKIKSFPIDYIISINSPKTILKTSCDNDQLHAKILHTSHLPEKINELKNKYPNPLLSPYLVQKVSKLLLDYHTEKELNILQDYGISHHEVIKGVQCPSCFNTPMIRTYGTWKCIKCGTRSKTAYQQAVFDYLHVINPKITNQECCHFLNISSQHLAYRLLSSMNLPFTGSTKDRKYHLPK